MPPLAVSALTEPLAHGLGILALHFKFGAWTPGPADNAMNDPGACRRWANWGALDELWCNALWQCDSDCRFMLGLCPEWLILSTGPGYRIMSCLFSMWEA